MYGPKWESGQNIGTKSAFLHFLKILWQVNYQVQKPKSLNINKYIYKLEIITYFKNLWFKKYVN